MFDIVSQTLENRPADNENRQKSLLFFIFSCFLESMRHKKLHFLYSAHLHYYVPLRVMICSYLRSLTYLPFTHLPLTHLPPIFWPPFVSLPFWSSLVFFVLLLLLFALLRSFLAVLSLVSLTVSSLVSLAVSSHIFFTRRLYSWLGTLFLLSFFSFFFFFFFFFSFLLFLPFPFSPFRCLSLSAFPPSLNFFSLSSFLLYKREGEKGGPISSMPVLVVLCLNFFSSFSY